jgi:hypothetical protein
MTPKIRHQPVKLKQENLNQIRLQQPSLAQYDAFILQRRKNHDRSRQHQRKAPPSSSQDHGPEPGIGP